MPAGRPPLGPRHVERLSGDEESKRRLRLFLETLAGTKSVLEARTELGLSESHFHELRRRALQAAVDELSPRPAGRPTKAEPAETEELRALRKRVVRMETEVKIQATRADLAALMPHLVRRPVEDRMRQEMAQLDAAEETISPGTAGAEGDKPPRVRKPRSRLGRKRRLRKRRKKGVESAGGSAEGAGV